LGIYFNQSVWYKLSGKTRYGAYITIIGAIITLVLNLVLIPKMGYMGSAWATLACYCTMSIISWVWGQKHYPIPYQIPRIGSYLVLALGIYFFSTFLEISTLPLKLGIHAIFILLFFAFVFWKEKSFILSKGVSDL